MHHRVHGIDCSTCVRTWIHVVQVSSRIVSYLHCNSKLAHCSPCVRLRLHHQSPFGLIRGRNKLQAISIPSKNESLPHYLAILQYIWMLASRTGWHFRSVDRSFGFEPKGREFDPRKCLPGIFDHSIFLLDQSPRIHTRLSKVAHISNNIHMLM